MRNALPASSYIVKNNILYYIACLVFFSFCRLDSWEDLEKSSLVLLLLVSLNCWPATRLPSGIRESVAAIAVRCSLRRHGGSAFPWSMCWTWVIPNSE